MPRPVVIRVLLALLATIIILYTHQTTLYNLLDPERQIETLSQTPSPSSYNNNLSFQSPIPNVIHLIWLSPDLTFSNYLTIRSALLTLHPTQLNLHHTTLNTSNIWLAKLRENITLLPHDLDAEYPRQIQDGWQVAHIADLLRLDVLRDGGIYLDMDVIVLRSFEQLRYSGKDVVLGYEGGDRHGLCNALILARENAAFLTRWRESYSTFSKTEWNYHSVILPKRLAVQYPHEICAVAPTVFFWPTWTRRHVRYMHEVISGNEERELEEALAMYNGGMYVDQVAYHAWSQVARVYLDRLTPEIVMVKNTRFNMLIRRFIE